MHRTFLFLNIDFFIEFKSIEITIFISFIYLLFSFVKKILPNWWEYKLIPAL